MHKKDYEIVARCLKKSDTLGDAVRHMVNAFGQENPKFDEDKFLKAIRRGD